MSDRDLGNHSTCATVGACRNFLGGGGNPKKGPTW